MREREGGGRETQRVKRGGGCKDRGERQAHSPFLF